jgi:hypothetical protein
MKSTYKADMAAIAAFTLMAVLAIAAPLTNMAPSFRLFAVFGAVLLGPASVAYRLATERRWSDCLAIGAGINVAIAMLLGQLLVSVHFWHPTQFELLMPVATFLLSSVLLWRVMSSSSKVRR